MGKVNIKQCMRCQVEFRGHKFLCATCAEDWFWCPRGEHIVSLDNTITRQPYCNDCFAEYTRERRGLPALACSYPDCPALYGGRTFLRNQEKPMCPEHRKTHRYCTECLEIHPIAAFNHSNGNPSKSGVCRARRVALDRLRNQEIKEQVLNFYGPGCACCGEAFLGFLSIQHVNGDGADRRRGDRNADNYAHLLCEIRQGIRRDDLVTLCMNCNHNVGNEVGFKCSNPAHAVVAGVGVV